MGKLLNRLRANLLHRIAGTAMFCLIAAAMAAQAQEGAPRGADAAYVEIWISGDTDLERFAALGLNVTNVRDRLVTLLATPDEQRTLREQGYRLLFPRLESPDKGVDSYETYATLTTKLMAFAEDYPAIARLSSLGQSIQGRELWTLFISDNPDLEEDEPEFKYVSTMHGDEPVGTELCVLLIDRLLSDYGTDARITEIVDETALWIVPLMNPDGLELFQRGNANGIDLNRSFPVFPTNYSGTIFTQPLSTEGRQPEVAHIMNWTAANSFALSANLHTGALVVNYPYDHTPGISSGAPAPSPDEALFRAISLRYSILNLPMYDSAEFPLGVVNGSDWFAITGGMQDWNYRFAGVPEVTIELSDVKRPFDTALAGLWADNEEAMLAYIEAAQLGLRGVVTDRSSGEPVYAQVTVQGNPQPVFTDIDLGDYHRLLLPGAQTAIVQAPGYITWREQVEIVDGPATRLDVALSDGDVNGDGAVDAVDLQLMINAILLESSSCACDVDGGGVSASDLQSVVNRVLGLI